MSVLLLRTLIAIADKGSFAAAADHVCVSHAAVGQQMKRLEETLKVSLFDRSRKIPLLNDLGKALVPKAREVVAAYDTMLVDISEGVHLAGELTLGAVQSAIRGLIPLSIKKLVENYPELHIRVVPGLSGDLQEQVERGLIDAAVLSMQNVAGSDLNWQPFVEEELVLIASCEIKENDPVKLLKEQPYIRHTRRAVVGVLADEWLLKNKLSVKASMEMESLETVSSMVSHGLGVSIVPNICVQDPIFASLKKVSLGDSVKSRILGVLTRSDCPKSFLVEKLLEMIKLTVAEHQGKTKVFLS